MSSDETRHLRMQCILHHWKVKDEQDGHEGCVRQILWATQILRFDIFVSLQNTTSKTDKS